MSLRNLTIGFIGFGNIGCSAANLLMPSASRMLIYDPDRQKIKGKILDLCQGALIFQKKSVEMYQVDHIQEIKSCDVIIITAGQARRPDMGRNDLMKSNDCVIQEIAKGISGTGAFVIVVTNPVDVLSWRLWKLAGLDPRQVVGMAGILDSARLCYYAAEALKANPEEISGLVLGMHHDSMVPVRSSLEKNGKPLEDKELSQESWDLIVEKTRFAGATIVNFLQTGSAFYGPAAAIEKMVKAWTEDQRCVLPCSVWVDQIYEEKQAFYGVPVVLGRSGVKEIMPCMMSPKEREELKKGVEIVRSLYEIL